MKRQSRKLSLNTTTIWLLQEPAQLREVRGAEWASYKAGCSYSCNSCTTLVGLDCW